MSGWRLIEMDPGRVGGDSQLATAWRAAEALGPASPFQSFIFARHWLAAFAQSVALRVWWHDDPPLLVPLILRDHTASLLGEGLFDFTDLIGSGDHPLLLRQAAERVLASAGPRAQFTGVRADTAFAGFWRALAPPQPFSAAPTRPALAGPILHSRTAPRWQRALHAGIALRHDRHPADRRALLDWMLLRKQQTPNNVLGEPERRWLLALVEHEPDLAEMWSLRHGPTVLSALLCWRFRGTRYAYTISYESSEAHLSPGVLLLYAVVGCTMAQGWNFDFLTGEQAFKLRFATSSQTLFRYAFDRQHNQSGQ